MKRYDSPIDAAMDLYLIADATTQARQAAILRSGLRESRGPLRAVRLVYGEQLPASAFLAMLASFSGRATASLSLEDPAPVEREGFYARGKDTFHPDSETFEQAADEDAKDALMLAQSMIAEGVNIVQCSDVFPLSSRVTAVFEGTLEDFADLYFEHGPVANGSHPAARQFAMDVWADIATRYRSFAEAYMEQGR